MHEYDFNDTPEFRRAVAFLEELKRERRAARESRVDRYGRPHIPDFLKRKRKPRATVLDLKPRLASRK